MRISPKAARQLYPHLVTVPCDTHGENQLNARVPKHLSKLFEGSNLNGWACASCVKEAKDEYTKQEKELKRKKKEEASKQKEENKKTKEAAKAADAALVDDIALCAAASDAVTIVNRSITDVRSNLRIAASQSDKAKQAVEAAKIKYADSLILLKELDLRIESLMTELEEAYANEDLCYNNLQSKLDTADSLWDQLGKSSKRKRGKTNRKAALDMLKSRTG